MSKTSSGNINTHTATQHSKSVFCAQCATFHNVRRGRRLTVAIAHLKDEHRIDVRQRAVNAWGSDHDAIVREEVANVSVLAHARQLRLAYVARMPRAQV